MEELKAKNPEDLQKQFNGYFNEIQGYKNTIREQEDLLKPLQEEFSKYRAEKEKRSIRSEIWGIAKNYRILNEAKDDILDLARYLARDERGAIRTIDDTLINTLNRHLKDTSRKPVSPRMYL